MIILFRLFIHIMFSISLIYAEVDQRLVFDQLYSSNSEVNAGGLSAFTLCAKWMAAESLNVSTEIGPSSFRPTFLVLRERLSS